MVTGWRADGRRGWKVLGGRNAKEVPVPVRAPHARGPEGAGSFFARPTRILQALLVGAGVGVLGAGAGVVSAGYGSGGSGLGLGAPTPAGATTSHVKTVTVSTAKVAHIGTVLTTGSGLTLYRFGADPAGSSVCTGGCAKIWPPFFAAKGAHIKGPKGLKGLSLIEVGTHWQVAFHHVALYRFEGDKKKGQANGQNIGHTWFAVLKSGVPPATAAGAAGATAGTPTTSAPSSTTTNPPAPTTATPGSHSSTNSAPIQTPAPQPTTPPTSPPTTPRTSPPTTPPTSPPPPPTTTTTAPPSGGGVNF